MTGPQLMAIDDLLAEFDGSAGRPFFAGPVTQEALKDLRREHDELRDALASLIDSEPCRFDHNGACQEHLYFAEPGECHVVAAKKLLENL